MQDMSLTESDSENGNENMVDTTHLTSEDLMALRKPAEAKLPSVNGEKFYTADKDDMLMKNVVQCALDDYKHVLEEKRAARICDLMQAEWNEYASIAVTKKLKGKFTQHIGHPIQDSDEIALFPEEALFMLENGSLEILHGEMPMSTEEAYAVMLNTKLGMEKYQVYSHLSRLGFIVVHHQLKLGVTRYEKLMNLDKHKIKTKKKKRRANINDKHINKSLDFSGCINNNPVSNCESHSCEQHINEVQTTSNEIQNSVVESNKNENSSDTILSNVGNNLDSELFLETEHCEELHCHENLDVSASDPNNEPANEDQIEILVSKEPNDDFRAIQNVCEVSSYVDNGSCDLHRYTAAVNPANLDVNASDPNNDPSNEDQIEILVSKEPTDDFRAIQNVCEVSSYIDNGSCDLLSPSSSDTCDVSIMPHEPQNGADQTDYTNENSSAAVETREIANMVHENKTNFESYRDNSSDVQCVNSDANGSDSIASVDSYKSQEKKSKKELQVDEGIFFVEVKKKEKKPMAVIDLLSDNEDNNDSDASEVDDDIQVIKVCEKSPRKLMKPTRQSFPKLELCKTESPTKVKVRPRIKATSNMSQLPNFFRKDFACLARPPNYLLPPNVCPAKEAYPIDVNAVSSSQRSEHRQESPNVRVWNSYKDLEERRRQNRYQSGYSHGPRFQMYRGSHFSRDTQNFSPFASNNSHRSFFSTESESSQQNYNPVQSANPFSSFQPVINQNRLGEMVYRNTMMHTSRNPNLLNFPNDRLTEQVCQEVQRTALRVATDVLSSVFGGGSNQGNVSDYMNHRVDQNFSNSLPPTHQEQRNVFNFVASSRHSSSIGSFQGNRSPFRNSSYLGPSNGMNDTFNRPTPWQYPQVNALWRPSSSSQFPQMPPNDIPTYWQGQPRDRDPYVNRQYPRREHRFRSREEFKQSVYPSAIPRKSNSHSWRDYKSAFNSRRENNVVVYDDNDDEENDDDIEEVPINVNEVLWSKDITPLIKPGSELPVDDVFACLKVIKPATLSEKVNVFEKYLPSKCSLRVSFDVYLPGTGYRKSCPGVPNHRIVVVRSTDPFPKLSDIVFLQRKYNDGAFIQFAIVDNGDVSFYSFNNVELPSIVPHEK